MTFVSSAWFFFQWMQCFPCLFLCPPLLFLCTSQNHRLVEVGRGLWRPQSNPPAQAKVNQSSAQPEQCSTNRASFKGKHLKTISEYKRYHVKEHHSLSTRIFMAKILRMLQLLEFVDAGPRHLPFLSTALDCTEMLLPVPDRKPCSDLRCYLKTTYRCLLQTGKSKNKTRGKKVDREAKISLVQYLIREKKQPD